MLYNENTDRAKRGKKFQTEFYNLMLENKLNVIPTWDYFKQKNKNYTKVDLAKLELRNGDILLFDERKYIIAHFELFTLLNDDGLFPVSKTKNFIGDNKYYVIKLLSNDDVYLMHSKSWNSYARKINKQVNVHGKDFYCYNKNIILNFRNKIKIDCGVNGNIGSIKDFVLGSNPNNQKTYLHNEVKHANSSIQSK